MLVFYCYNNIPMLAIVNSIYELLAKNKLHLMVELTFKLMKVLKGSKANDCDWQLVF